MSLNNTDVGHIPLSPAHIASLVIAGVFGAGAIGLSLHLIWQHLTNYSDPRIQRKILRVLWMVPVYSLTSFCSLLFPSAALYLDTLRDAYEAYAIYAFFALLVEYLGGPQTLRLKLASKDSVHHPWPLHKLKPVSLSSGTFLRNMQQGTLQFVIVKPTMAMLAIILAVVGVYNEGTWSFRYGYLYVVIIDNVAVSVALYCLVLFYLGLHDDLKPFDPFSKFMCVKSVVFFAYWQGVVISFLVYFNVIPAGNDKRWTPEAIGIYIQDFLICIEMFFAAVGHIYAFSADPYRPGGSASQNVEGGGDAIKGLSPSPVAAKKSSSVEKQALLHSVKDMVSVRDVAEDTYRTFKPIRGSADVPIEFVSTPVT